MLLRDHPLLTYQSSRSWPPAWLYCRGFDNTHPRGEVGILKNVFVSSFHPSTRCYLIMEHAGGEYMGDLSISDVAFCMQIYAVLLRYCGKTMQEIGDIDLSDARQVSDMYPHQPPSPHPAFLPVRRAGHEVLNGRLALIDPLLRRCEARFYSPIVSLERIMHGEGHEYVLRAFAVENE